MGAVITYKVSASGRGFVTLWRAWRVVVPVVIVNAVIQAVLVLPGVLPAPDPAFVALALVSWLTLVASCTAVMSALLRAVDGGADAPAAIANAVARFPRMLLWSTLLLAATVLGLIVFVIPGLVVLALTPYLLIAVVDGRRNPLAANFRAIGRSPGRWFVTVSVMALICLVLWVLAVANGFFVTGAPAALIGWSVLGFVASWFACTWILVYRGAVKTVQ